MFKLSEFPFRSQNFNPSLFPISQSYFLFRYVISRLNLKMKFIVYVVFFFYGGYKSNFPSDLIGKIRKTVGYFECTLPEPYYGSEKMLVHCDGQ